jgi:hypothetical protein
VEDLRATRARGRLVVAAAAAATMLVAPFALLHGGAAPAATAAGSGGRPAAVAPGPTSLGATQLVSSDAPARPATAAALARHRSAVRFNAELRAAAVRRWGWRDAAAVRRGERWAAAARDALIRHDAAVAQNEALRAAAAARHRAAVEAAARRAGRRSAVGVATWYGWYPNQCASPFLPHGTLLTVTDLATHKTIQCLVTDTEAHNPGRVVDLSEYCFEELAALSQGIILVRITW